MAQILKAARVDKQTLDDEELSLINRQTLRPLTEEEVFTFRLAACDNQVDRDWERFTDGALEALAPMFVGKSVLLDHTWRAGSQTARVYGANVEGEGEVKRLILRCYMPRDVRSAPTISALEAGILRECSVGCAVEKVLCSICGADQTKTACPHVPGKEYEGQRCVMALDGARDAYEVSLVAVPAQPEAGVVKSKRYGGQEPEPAPAQDGRSPAEEKPATVMERLANMMKRKEEVV